MHRYRFFSVALLFCAAVLGAQQVPGMSPPPPPLDPEKATRAPRPETIRRRIGLVDLQRQADDLARTAQTIPSDVASIRKGMLPKDVIEKLKQIERLSKRLRAELNP